MIDYWVDGRRLIKAGAFKRMYFVIKKPFGIISEWF